MLNTFSQSLILKSQITLKVIFLEEGGYFVTIQFSFVDSTIIGVGAECIFVFTDQTWITPVSCSPKIRSLELWFSKLLHRKMFWSSLKNIHGTLCRKSTIQYISLWRLILYFKYWRLWYTLEVNLVFVKLLTDTVHYDMCMQRQWIF